MTPDPIYLAVLAGDVRAVARAISLVEDDAAAGTDLLRALFQHTGRAFVVGVTGPPGAGKSTLVDRLTVDARRAGKRVGVIAVDPTSAFSGGAVLGDRVRMGRHASDEGVFIRSMATRGHLGGVARTTGDVAMILDAAGKDLVIIETVGVGQDEIDIARTADVTLVVLVPGTGDDVQALKAGIMEIADIFVVNKADRDGADHLVQTIAANLALQPGAAGDWQPPIIKTTATTGEGVEELWSVIEKFRAQRTTDDRRRRARSEHHFRALLGQHVIRRLEQALPAGELDRMVGRIAAREVDPYSAADALLERALAQSPVSTSRSPSTR